MSDNEVQAPQGNLAQAPLSGLLQGFQFGAGLANQKQANADAADQRQQQQANFESQLDLQRQSQQAEQQYRQQSLQQAADQFNKTYIQSGKIADAEMAAKAQQMYLGQFNKFLDHGYGFAEALTKTKQSADYVDPTHPLSNVPVAHLQDFPLPVVLDPSDPGHPANGQLQQGQSPISPFVGPNGERFSDTQPNAGSQAQLADTPAGRVAQTAQGQGYAQVSPQQGQGIPQGMPQGMPQGQPSQPQQPPVQGQQSVQSILNPQSGLNGAPPQGAGGGVPPMMGQPAGMPPATAPVPAAANAALQQQAQTGALQLMQKAPDLPAPPPDAAPDVLQAYQMANQKYHTDIQAAQDSHDGVAADLAYKSAQTALLNIQRQQMQDEAKTGVLRNSLENGLLQANIDAKRADIQLQRAHFDFEKQQADAAMKYKAASDAADRQLQLQLHSGTAQGGGEFQKAVTGMIGQLSDVHDRSEKIQDEINHVNYLMSMSPNDVAVLQQKASDPTASAKIREQAQKDITAYHQLTATVPNPVAGQPLMKAGHLYAQTLQSHWNDLNDSAERIKNMINLGNDKLKAMSTTSDPVQAAKDYLKAHPAGSTGAKIVPPPSTPKATTPPSKVGAKGVAPVTPPDGMKKAPPAKAPTGTPKTIYSTSDFAVPPGS